MLEAKPDEAGPASDRERGTRCLCLRCLAIRQGRTLVMFALRLLGTWSPWVEDITPLPQALQTPGQGGGSAIGFLGPVPSLPGRA